MTTQQVVLFGALGALLPDALRIIKDRYNPGLPPFLKSGNFWLGLVLAVALGAGVAVLAHPADVKTALAFGFGAPEIITRLLSTPPPTGPVAAADAPRTRRTWWAV